VSREGTEFGGLQYAGFRGTDGKALKGNLTVDHYEQNESPRLGMCQNGATSPSAPRPDRSTEGVLTQREP
jgi:hypothetical protein